MGGIVENILSFVVGTLSSSVVWWWTARKLTPSVEFSEEVIEYEVPSGEKLFQCVFVNSGKRAMIDVSVIVRYKIGGFMGTHDDAFFSVRSNVSQIPEISPGGKRKVRLFDEREIIEFIDIPSKPLRERVLNCKSMKDILALGEAGELRVHVFGYDAFSGARRHFKSKPYKAADIRKGRYDGLDVAPNIRLADYRRVGDSNSET